MTLSSLERQDMRGSVFTVQCSVMCFYGTVFRNVCCEGSVDCV